MKVVGDQFKTDSWFYVFIAIHLFLWTVVPFWVRYNLPMDSIEGSLWGHQLEWGYDKNPFLNAWLTTLATYLDGHSGLIIYFFSQLSVVIAFFAVYQLAKCMLTPVYAILSVMILEGIQYYNLHAIDFNDNTLELSLWALTIYFFYKALRSPSYFAWIFTGIFAALGMMAKYYTAVLLSSMALFLWVDAHHRQQLKTLAPYVGLIFFLVIITPHFIWLFFNDFITIKYVFERTASTPHWINHFVFPLQFTLEQLQALSPTLAMMFLLCIFKPAKKRFTVMAFDKAFLWYVGVGPFLLTLLLSFLFNWHLHGAWGMPLFSLWGIMLFSLLKPVISPVKFYRFYIGILVLMIALTCGYSYSLIDSDTPSSANYPGQEIANVITHKWQQQFNTPLAFVAGSRWVSGNVEFYSPDHPAVFIAWNKKLSPWIDINELKQKGGVFVWEVSKNEKLPQTIRDLFPELQQPMILEFPWHRNNHHLSAIKIGIAILPPVKSQEV